MDFDRVVESITTMTTLRERNRLPLDIETSAFVVRCADNSSQVVPMSHSCILPARVYYSSMKNSRTKR